MQPIAQEGGQSRKTREEVWDYQRYAEAEYLQLMYVIETLFRGKLLVLVGCVSIVIFLQAKNYPTIENVTVAERPMKTQ